MLGREQVTKEGILKALGGQELLELMIEARSFRTPFSHNSDGLVFNFRDVNKQISYASFIPQSSFSFEYPVASYKEMTSFHQLLIRIVGMNANPKGIYTTLNESKSHVSRSEDIITTFENLTQLALHF